MRRLLALPLGLTLLLTTGGVASAADFTITPSPANPGQQITVTPVLTPVEEAAIDALGFQFADEEPEMDETAPFEAVSHTYAAEGVKTITMRIDPLVGDDGFITHTIRINAAPQARFSYAPTVPNVNEQVRFDAGATTDDAGLDSSVFEWDIDGDGNFDAVGRVVQRAFGIPGDRTVRLRVTDSGGRQDTVQHVVHVNRPPHASFFFSPRAPRVGESISFTSISEDLDNPIVAQVWDLDGDGQYDDARGDTVSRVFTSAGRHVVRLRVTDARGRTDSVGQSLSVADLPPRPPPKRISPWPKIRIVGFAGAARTRVDLLSIRTIVGSTVKVRCRGRGCPRTRAVSTRARRKLVRVRWLERKLRNRTRIAIAITAPGRIGRYEILTLRKKKEPKRRTLCLWPGEARARSCGDA